LSILRHQILRLAGRITEAEAGRLRAEASRPKEAARSFLPGPVAAGTNRSAEPSGQGSSHRKGGIGGGRLHE
jgi:hypothetical protein